MSNIQVHVIVTGQGNTFVQKQRILISVGDVLFHFVQHTYYQHGKLLSETGKLRGVFPGPRSTFCSLTVWKPSKKPQSTHFVLKHFEWNWCVKIDKEWNEANMSTYSVTLETCTHNCERVATMRHSPTNYIDAKTTCWCLHADTVERTYIYYLSKAYISTFMGTSSIKKTHLRSTTDGKARWTVNMR